MNSILYSIHEITDDLLPMNTQLKLRVAEKKAIAEGIVLLELISCDGADLPAFTAGSHLQIELPGGHSRAYSLCNDPAERHRYQLAVNLDAASRGGSRAVHEAIHAGDTVEAREPNNLFALEESAPHSVLFAGGIGITPMLSMVRRLQALGSRWELHYSTRSASRCAFLDELTTGELAKQSRLYFDDGARLDIRKALAATQEGTHLYVCGPAGFIDAVLGAAKNLGWSEERLHSERFSAQPVEASGNQAFKLVLERSGLTLDVPADRSVMSVLLEAGIDLPFSCEQGVCGTCITDVLEGRPDHRDQCLDEGMRQQCFTPCCSRSLDGLLRIDL